MSDAAANADLVLSIENLSIALPRGADRPWAVEDASLTVRRGEILCVIGESGSGKSVLSSAAMRAIPRGLRLASGRILFEGRDLATLSEREMRSVRGRRIAMIFQEPMAALNPIMSVGDQVEEMFRIHEPAAPRAETRRRMLALLKKVRLPDPEEMSLRAPHQLSGGQCQRIVIAMALALSPSLLIADEPTTALDATTQAEILRLICELRDAHGHGALFVTHDFGVVAEIADRVAVMRRGQIVETGTARQVLTRPSHPYTRALAAAAPTGIAPKRAPITAPPALTVEGLSKSYGLTKALDGVSLEIPAGATLAIVGESGSGKSTLARIVIRLTEASSGRVMVDGRNFAALSGARLRKDRRLIQMIFQDPYGSLNPRRTLGDVLIRAGVLGGLSTTEARKRAAALIARVGLNPEALDRKPHAFSGGQRQRIGIARALAMGPRIVIADECASALDVSVQKQILDLLEDLKRETGLTLLFITPDLRVAAEIADDVAVMRRGRLVERGPPAQIMAEPRSAYTAELVAAMPGRSFTAKTDAP